MPNRAILKVKPKKSVKSHPLVGMRSKDIESVTEVMKKLREPHYSIFNLYSPRLAAVPYGKV